MSELERQLHALAGEVAYPPTPDLTTRVGARLGAAHPAPVRLPLGRALALAGIWVLATAGTVIAASREAADALLDASGLTGVTVERTTEPAPVATFRDLDLGTRTTLEQAAADLDFEPLVPLIAGGPDAVYERSTTPGGELSLIYEPRAGLPPTTTTGAGLVVSEFRGDLSPDYLGKIAPQTTTVESLQIGGERALWISGAPHFFFYRSPDGETTERDLFVAQNVLLVEQGDVLVRMEGAFDRDTAVRLAGTLAPFGL